MPKYNNPKGRIGSTSEMQFFILCGHCSSEYGTYSFQNTRLQITADNEEISVSYYQPNPETHFYREPNY